MTWCTQCVLLACFARSPPACLGLCCSLSASRCMSTRDVQSTRLFDRRHIRQDGGLLRRFLGFCRELPVSLSNRILRGQAVIGALACSIGNRHGVSAIACSRPEFAQWPATSISKPAARRTRFGHVLPCSLRLCDPDASSLTARAFTKQLILRRLYINCSINWRRTLSTAGRPPSSTQTVCSHPKFRDTGRSHDRVTDLRRPPCAGRGRVWLRKWQRQRGFPT
jgi:hypothetical protein